jgi:hypothetical protein
VNLIPTPPSTIAVSSLKTFISRSQLIFAEAGATTNIFLAFDSIAA